MKRHWRNILLILSGMAALACAPGLSGAAAAPAQPSNPLHLTINLDGTEGPAQMSVAVQIVIVMTLLTIAPSIVLLTTRFTRIVIVLGFVRLAGRLRVNSSLLGLAGVRCSQQLLAQPGELTVLLLNERFFHCRLGAGHHCSRCIA